jgi:hypothetical protein
LAYKDTPIESNFLRFQRDYQLAMTDTLSGSALLLAVQPRRGVGNAWRRGDVEFLLKNKGQKFLNVYAQEIIRPRTGE